VIAEHLAQRLVQQMRRRMIAADVGAARVIDLERERAADLSVPCSTVTACANTSPALFCVSVTRARRRRASYAGVADLSAGLAIERRLVQHHAAALAGLQLGDLLAVAHSAVTTPSALSVS
jgi:hypothetical protein